mmetsp:Transcript_29058/g.39922  ORF Transcript_29058/g.39922 Transcript_29058/m.39922 type:complete len:113 (+) Transcript_29058:699-1037(+)
MIRLCIFYSGFMLLLYFFLFWIVSVFVLCSGTKQENAEMGTTAVKPPQAVVSKKEEKSNKESNDCVICMDRKSEYAIVPCGHKCLCSECQALPSITTCPICRGPKAFMLKIY